MQRFEVSTTDESEAEEFIRQMYVENRFRFHGAREGALLSATAARAGGIAADRLRSTIDYSVTCDPFDYYLFATMHHGRLRYRRGGDETVVAAGNCSFFPLGVALAMDLHDQGARLLRLPAARLEAVAEQTAGINPADLRSHAAVPVSARTGAQWMALTGLAGTCRWPTTARPPIRCWPRSWRAPPPSPRCTPSPTPP